MVSLPNCTPMENLELETKRLPIILMTCRSRPPDALTSRMNKSTKFIIFIFFSSQERRRTSCSSNKYFRDWFTLRFLHSSTTWSLDPDRWHNNLWYKFLWRSKLFRHQRPIIHTYWSFDLFRCVDQMWRNRYPSISTNDASPNASSNYKFRWWCHIFFVRFALISVHVNMEHGV